MTNYEAYEEDIEGAKDCAAVAALVGIECGRERGDGCADCLRYVMAWAAAEHEDTAPPALAPELRRLCKWVIYVEHYGHYNYYYYADGKIEKVRETQAEAAEKLTRAPQFIEVNRGIILNMAHVQALAQGVAIMSNGARIPWSRRKAMTTQQAIKEWRQADDKY